MMIELEEERPLYGAKVVQSFLYPTGVVKTLYIGKDDLPRFLPRLEMSPVNRFFFRLTKQKPFCLRTVGRLFFTLSYKLTSKFTVILYELHELASNAGGGSHPRMGINIKVS